MYKRTIFFVCWISLGFGQEHIEEDSSSTLSFIDKMIVKINLDSQTESFTVNTNDVVDYSLATNDLLRLNLSLDYEFLGVSVGFAPRFFPGNNDDGLQGKSSYSNYGFRFFLGNWIQGIQYKKAQGFYVENTQDFLDEWNMGIDPYIQFPDFKTTYWGGSTSYVINPKFSLRNVLYNTEWQRKSAGSFIPTLRYGLFRVSSLIDNVKAFENSYDIRQGISYYYTLVIHKNWFLTPFLSPSAGIRFSREGEEGVDQIVTNTYLPFGLDGGLQLGYSSRKVIFGLNFNFESVAYATDEQTNVSNDNMYGKIYLGYRFDAPTIVKKPFDWVNDAFGL